MVGLLVAVIAVIVVDIISRYVSQWQAQKRTDALFEYFETKGWQSVKRIDSLVEYLEQTECVTKACTDHMLKLEEVMRGLQSTLHTQEDKLVSTLRKKRKTSAD